LPVSVLLKIAAYDRSVCTAQKLRNIFHSQSASQENRQSDTLLAAFHLVYAGRHSCVKSRDDHCVSVLRLDIHRLLFHAAVMNNIVASVLYIDVAQEGDI